MEGRYWQCQWERCDGGFRVWVTNRPQFAATSKHWQGALDAISAVICDASGDGEPRLSFDPPEPLEGGDGKYAHPDWVQLGAEGYVPVDVNRPGLFSQGICEHCLKPVGERTEEGLSATGAASGDLCWPGYLGEPYLPVMFSEKLLNALTPEEREPFEWMPVQRDGRSRIRYFECVPRMSFVRAVAVRGFAVVGTDCPVCHHRWMICTSESDFNHSSTSQIHEWVCGAELPSPPIGMVAFGTTRGWLPLVPIDRGRELARAFRGIRITRVGLAPADRADHGYPLTALKAQRP